MLFIIIPVFNRWVFTLACLKSLEQQSEKKNFKTIVVDHGSTDGTSDYIEMHFPWVKVLQGDKSMWWTAATNLGIEYALARKATYILTLNNDTLAEPDYISEIYKAIDAAPQNALIGSTSINVVTKKVTYRGEIINWFFDSKSFNSNSVVKEPESGLISASYFPGRGLIIPKRVFEKIGLFDQTYFPHYMADYEFTLRAKREGFLILCAWNAKIATYPEESGANNLKAKTSLNAYKEHLFGMKGGANLPLFYRFAWRHCPAYALPFYLLSGTARRLIGYWLNKE
jgi:GT2 family glycosyltransferase